MRRLGDARLASEFAVLRLSRQWTGQGAFIALWHSSTVGLIRGPAM